MGGAAIVPRSAHVRNCLITGCQATKGGALYLLKGGIVSGSVITGNSATDGGAPIVCCTNHQQCKRVSMPM